MEAPLQIVGCLLSSEPADALIDGFATAVRRERAVVTARNAQSATFVRFNATDAKLVAMACAAAAGPAGSTLQFGFACAVKERALSEQDAWSISNRCITQAHDLAAAAQAGEVLVSPQLALLLLESGLSFQPKEIEVSGGRTVAACALDLAADAQPGSTPEEPPDQLARLEARLTAIAHIEQRLDQLQLVSSELEHKLAEQLARHAAVQSMKTSNDTLLTQVAGVQRKLDDDVSELRAKVEDLLGRVHDTDGKIAMVESRRKMVEEVQARANSVIHMLEDINVNLDMLGEQRAVVDQVGDKLARLDFTLQEARNTLRTLQREREMAERIEQSIKALRTRSGVPKAALQGEVVTTPPSDVKSV